MQAILKDMLGELLDMAQISQARRLSQLFDVYTVDLHMVLVSTLCIADIESMILLVSKVIAT